MIENPKLVGSRIIDCKPQVGKCPMDCNQCFYNRPNAFYVNPEEPILPDMFEVGDKIVRVNSGHDSNVQKDLVIESTKKYPKKFYNTSISKSDFPAPVVFTANRYEEDFVTSPQAFPWEDLKNIMAVRLRVSSTNLNWIDLGVTQWAKGMGIPVILTFMAYYTDQPADKDKYEWRVRHINSYWCPKKSFISEVMERERKIGGELVLGCGLGTGYCKDCGNCERLYYRIMKKRENEKGY